MALVRAVLGLGRWGCTSLASARSVPSAFCHEKSSHKSTAGSPHEGKQREQVNLDEQAARVARLDKLCSTGAHPRPKLPPIASLLQLPNEEQKDKRLYSEIRILIRGFDKAVMKSYFKFVRMAAFYLDVDCSGVVRKPVYLKRWTVIKGPFKHKMYKVQYEQRHYCHYVTLRRLTGPTADTFLEYIQRNLPEGLMMSVLQESLEPFPNLDNIDNIVV